MSRQVYLLALALALVAAFCVSSSNADGSAFTRYYSDANCTTNMNNDSPYENTTLLPSSCQPGHGGRPYVITRACSLEEGLVFDVYSKADCSETSHVHTTHQEIGICISVGTISIASWCNLTSVQNISGTAKFISTPADVQVAPGTVNGSGTSSPCPIEGCGEAYVTGYIYEDENCTGNITNAYLTTTIAKIYEVSIEAWYATDACLQTSRGTPGLTNLTARFECDENFLTYTSYAGDCQDSNNYETVQFPLNKCILSPAGQWYKSVCPRATSPISSPVEAPTADPVVVPLAGPVAGPVANPVESPAPESIPSIAPLSTPIEDNPISPVTPPTGDANAISSVSAMVLVMIAVLAVFMA